MPGSKDVIEAMITMADIAMQDEDYERAVQNYKNILMLESNDIAQYNLGSLFAQGKGVKRDFKEGAYWFHQAELGGDEKAGQLCLKCALDYAHQDFDSKSPEQIYKDMTVFIIFVYPDIDNINLEVCRKLYSFAMNHLNKKEYAAAAKFFRAAAEYGKDGYAQYYLGSLYNAGNGVRKNDLASLYWLDKSADNDATDSAQKNRDGLLSAFKSHFSQSDFFDAMMKLSGWCRVGTEDIPKDANKASFWRSVGETYLSSTN